MGKQVNYYMGEEDETEFARFVFGLADTVILGTPSEEATPPVFHSLPPDDAPIIYLDQVFLWRAGYPLFTDYMVMRGGPLKGQGVYFIEESRSSVIEFSRSVLLPEENLLTRGRIWADMHRLEGDHFVYKGEEFEKWYDSIAAWIRRRYRKLGTKPYFYIGPQAYEWHQAGGQLQP